MTPIPENCLKLSELPSLLFKSKYPESAILKEVWIDGEREYQKAVEDISLVEKELLKPFMEGTLEVLVIGTDDKEYRIPPDELSRAAEEPFFDLFFADELFGLPDSILRKHHGRQPLVRRSEFDAWLMSQRTSNVLGEHNKSWGLSKSRKGQGAMFEMDVPWLEKMHELLVSHQVPSIAQAARKFASDANYQGRASPESSAKRLERNYRLWVTRYLLQSPNRS
jgi:hypothetical protein